MQFLYYGELALQLHEQEQENSEARSIQQGLLPKEIPQFPGYEIATAWQSARVVGGDYFDVLPFDADSLGLCIADVAGKGFSAALLMSNLQAAVRGLAAPSFPRTFWWSARLSAVNRDVKSPSFCSRSSLDFSEAC